MDHSARNRTSRWLAAALLVASLPLQAHAGSLEFIDSFPVTFKPEGLGFHRPSGHLFVSSQSGSGSTIYEFTTAGQLVRSFKVTPENIHGVEALPNGNLLLSDATGSNGGVLYEYTTGGVRISGGTVDVNPPSKDPDGAAYHSVMGTYFTADEDSDRIFEVFPNGTKASEINTKAIHPLFKEPEGITIDALTGNLLVVNDKTRTSTTGVFFEGMFELTVDGALVQYTSLKGLTAGVEHSNGYIDPDGFIDPEGVSIDSVTGLIYVAFSLDKRVGVFHLTP